MGRASEEHLTKFANEKLGIKNERNQEKFVNLRKKIQKGYAGLSLKAMCKIVPFLKEGFLYNEAVILAKIPQLIGKQWDNQKSIIYETVKTSHEQYKQDKKVIGIANNLIDRYKGLKHEEQFAYKNYEYTLEESDEKDIKKACSDYFGAKTWKAREDQEEIISKVGKEYQEFFYDENRKYRELPTLASIFETELEKKSIPINKSDLYHHSNRKNRYTQNLLVDKETGKFLLPKDKKTGIEILPTPRIDSIGYFGSICATHFGLIVPVISVQTVPLFRFNLCHLFRFKLCHFRRSS